MIDPDNVPETVQDPDFAAKYLLQNREFVQLATALFWRARARLFRRSDPFDKVTCVAEAGEEELVTTLARQGFSPKWPFAFHYEGEDANLVRFWYDETYGHPFRQDHIRIFTEEYERGYVGIAAHSEASALVHPWPHLKNAEIDREQGEDRARRAIAAGGIVTHDRPDIYRVDANEQV